MAGASRSIRASSFGSVVGDYERGRPTYPAEAVAWLTGREPARVVDLGAGTGKLTRSLVALGHHVIAADPSLLMLRELDVRVPSANRLGAVAEAIPVRDDWAAVVTAGQAFHWFDVEKALPEIARVLRNGGRLGLIWNTRDETVAWVRELSTMIGDERPGDDDWRDGLIRSPLVRDLEHRVFRFEQQLSREDLLALVRSRSYVATLSDNDRRSVLTRVLRLCDEHPDLAGRETLTMAYKTEAYRAVVSR